MATKIIDIYNNELVELKNIKDIQDDYVILMNKNDNSTNSNIKVKTKLLKQYFLNDVPTSTDISTLNTQIGTLTTSLNEIKSKNEDLEQRLQNVENLLSLSN